MMKRYCPNAAAPSLRGDNTAVHPKTIHVPMNGTVVVELSTKCDVVILPCGSSAFHAIRAFWAQGISYKGSQVIVWDYTVSQILNGVLESVNTRSVKAWCLPMVFSMHCWHVSFSWRAICMTVDAYAFFLSAFNNAMRIKRIEVSRVA